jgi:hypothetical protein
MPTTRPNGTPYTIDDPEYWEQPYVYREFPKMLYRQRRGSANELFPPQGTYTTADGIILEYIVVPDAAEEARAATAGWSELAAAVASTRGDQAHPSRER